MKRTIPPGPAPIQPASHAGPDRLLETKIRDRSTRRPKSMILQPISRQIWKPASIMISISGPLWWRALSIFLRDEMLTNDGKSEQNEMKIAVPCHTETRVGRFSSGMVTCFSSPPDLETKCEIRVDDFTRRME